MSVRAPPPRPPIRLCDPIWGECGRLEDRAGRPRRRDAPGGPGRLRKRRARVESRGRRLRQAGAACGGSGCVAALVPCGLTELRGGGTGGRRAADAGRGLISIDILTVPQYYPSGTAGTLQPRASGSPTSAECCKWSPAK
ncbi:hypothetical protein NDU88_008046 [Pleurodeles waltl]|uniref:Uncharacterized protein n=1 Tax=Pleurodeles waltl TaxID=8319 RepID=A0AAV7PVJ4_PLEWA|nr:hypothetical protein NDU88_008046 [Pleurodeles waltl]